MPTPPRKTTADFDPDVLRLFDQYVHGQIDRRGFLAGAARFAVGATTAAGLLAALSPQFAMAQQVKPDDGRLRASYLQFASPQGYGTGQGYLVRPANASGPLPVVLVVHENRGLNPHIEDVARRLALENFLVFAPDALFPLGGYPGDEDKARAEFAKLDQTKTRQDFIAAARLLQRMAGGNGQLGVVGFCYGGAIANFLATQLPELKAAAPFYGNAPGWKTSPTSRQNFWWCWRATTNASTQAGRRTRTRWKKPACAMRCCSHPGPSTVSTTTPRHATTRPLRVTHGRGRWTCSNVPCAHAQRLRSAELRPSVGPQRRVGAGLRQSALNGFVDQHAHASIR